MSDDDRYCPWCGEACEDGACTCDLPGGEVRLGAGFVKAHRIKGREGGGVAEKRMVLVRRGSPGAPGGNRGRHPMKRVSLK